MMPFKQCKHIFVMQWCYISQSGSIQDFSQGILTYQIVTKTSQQSTVLVQRLMFFLSFFDSQKGGYRHLVDFTWQTLQYISFPVVQCFPIKNYMLSPRVLYFLTVVYIFNKESIIILQELHGLQIWKNIAPWPKQKIFVLSIDQRDKSAIHMLSLTAL